MDFVKLLRSLEEFLYELLSWIVFYPRTLLRTLCNPAGVARYTHLQLKQPAGEQFLEMVSPVLMLLLSILIAHGTEMAADVTVVDARLGPLAATLFGTDQGLLLTRGFIFGTYSLVAAVWIMTRVRQRIDRNTLREPFFIQSYLVSPFALSFSTASVMMRSDHGGMTAAGLALSLLATLWYLWAQTSAYAELLQVGKARAFAYALAGFVGVTVLLMAASTALLMPR